MYFTNTPALRQCEVIMREVPGFRRQGNGAYRNLQRYIKEDCDCRRCPNYNLIKNGCSENMCPILDVRIYCGAAFFYEAVDSVFRATSNSALKNRLAQYIKTTKDGGFMIYRGKIYKQIFDNEKMRCDEKGLALSKRFLAAVYLLTADNFLWSRMKRSIQPNQISFEGVSLSGISPDGYVIWKAVKELYSGSKQLSFSELADQGIVSEDAFRLIIQAITIGRYGYAVTNLKGE